MDDFDRRFSHSSYFSAHLVVQVRSQFPVLEAHCAAESPWAFQGGPGSDHRARSVHEAMM
eukprot:117430-Hanusia_phi.AAC.1